MAAKSEHDRRYDYAHKQARKKWDALVQLGGINCHRCKKPILPGTKWHLDHHDDGTASSPSHASCNTATARIWKDRALGTTTAPAGGYCPCGNTFAWFTCPPGLPHPPN